MTKQKEAENLNESLKELSEMVTWFEHQQDIDVEAGLQKVKRGAELIRGCKKRLEEIENEFKTIQKEIEEDIDQPLEEAKVTNKSNSGIDYTDVEDVKPEDIPF